MNRFGSWIVNVLPFEDLLDALAVAGLKDQVHGLSMTPNAPMSP